MSILAPVLLGLGLALTETPGAVGPPRGTLEGCGPVCLSGATDLAHLAEVLHDRQDPRGQSQAALLLLQSADPAAEKLVRVGLRRPEETEVFLALTAAVRLRQDGRFLGELLDALASP